jgi:hypothetical protein
MKMKKRKMMKMNKNLDRRDRIRATAIANHHPNKADNILAPVEVQCLQDIGFGNVDYCFKVFELASKGQKPI